MRTNRRGHPDPIERSRAGRRTSRPWWRGAKLGSIQFSSREERQAENFRKMLLAMVDDIRVILVKLADRLHNMRTLHHLPEERRIKIAQETRDIYAPIANRLGMSKVKNELEELSFKYLEPQPYDVAAQRVEARRGVTKDDRGARKRTSRQAGRGPGAGDPHRRADLKRLFSIHQKLPAAEDRSREVYDLVALRIRDRSVRDCYAALGIIHQTWAPVRGPHQGFHSRCRGPQRLPVAAYLGGERAGVSGRGADPHRGDDRIAEEGIARHWKYKEGRIGRTGDEQYSCGCGSCSSGSRRSATAGVPAEPQDDLYPEEVYIFTPKGEVKALPRDATPVDFAYSIHTDVGHQCVGARVNGKMVPLRTRLRNGDIVEIVTTAGHKPSRDWLNFVTTSRARNKIKHYIHAEEKIRSSNWTQAVRQGGAPVRPEREDLDRRRALRGVLVKAASRKPTSCSPRWPMASYRRRRCWPSWFRRTSSRKRRKAR